MAKRRPPCLQVTASAPCRLDCGGTLDISPLALSLNQLAPATLNIALALRTEVTARPHEKGGFRVESLGFAAQEAQSDQDYDTPLGFFFLAGDYFGLRDVLLTVRSASPPRAALGGSSAAMVAAVAALSRLRGRRMARHEVVALAFLLEQALFSVPCGRQDHLAAAYGGVHHWTWTLGFKRGYKGRQLIKGSAYKALEDRLAVAYPGQTHSSADINGQWIRGFTSGRERDRWRRILTATHGLGEALARRRWAEAGQRLASETRLRLELTPEVLTETGRRLFETAVGLGVGARFTGAGGGGCLWALGPKGRIARLKEVWAEVLAPIPKAGLLPNKIDRQGLIVAVN